ncbi:CAP domain-containing protein [Lactobacillus sp. ESL0701]|uniref:CAP domain-containing protein n=1 Tax=Lactobacillus sp. ESL0701 TaxID=2983217 RepID=UPI0023F8C6C5|nr:CAP domain-containing protein [Lactobacillus sp. ESL0701]MDF7672831.1 CAP domain-containing protein [Lactobacillus sp. ESL0701]
MSRKLLITLASLLLVFPISSTTVMAAEFTPTEANKVEQFQQQYAALNKTPFNLNNLYEAKPKLNRRFKEGILAPSYLNTQLDYINYYRSLFDLSPVIENSNADLKSQKTAAVLAALNANPLINQHGLPYEKRPKEITRTTWKIAQTTSKTANLNFNTGNQSAGNVITDLLTDRYNLAGLDTGHRAWLLSTRLSSIGTGAAYGSNGYRYSVQKVLNACDAFRPASQELVTYPSKGLFPIELVSDRQIAWSLYFSNQTITTTPQITITDNDTAQTYQATNVTNYRDVGYGNFETIITYLPGTTPLIAGHEYEVKVSGICQYKFKLFKQE